MNLNLRTLPAKFLPIAEELKKYVVIIMLIFFAGIYGFLLLRISGLAASSPTEEAITEELKTVKRPRIDQQAADKIEQLQDQNISVQTLFKDARQNPFAE